MSIHSLLQLTTISAALLVCDGFNRNRHSRSYKLNNGIIQKRGHTQMSLDVFASSLIDFHSLHLPHLLQASSSLVTSSQSWIDLVSQGIADASADAASSGIAATAGTTTAETAVKVCADFGQPGWAPFCFLNGNPLFAAFDSYQSFIQTSVVSLHDFLKGLGIQNAYGPSIILFTVIVRLLLFPLTYQQLASTQRTQALQPKLQEIREKYADNKEVQNQMVALLYQETQVNPLAGCLPALFQIPVFLALYRSFLNLAQSGQLSESFGWLPNLEGPVYGQRNTDWLTGAWGAGNIPPLGWHDTLCFLSVPVLLVIAQAVSLRILTPPSDDPAVQQTQRILKYLPLMIGYFSLSVPAGLGVYWITNNILSTVTTGGVKEYFKRNPIKAFDVNIDKLANSQMSAYTNPAWGYTSREQMIEEAKLNYRPSRNSKIPADFTVSS